jgi:hypothetical protein
VQLTGKDNYRRYGQRVGLPLEATPDRANAPEIAAVLLALFLADKAVKFRDAIRNDGVGGRDGLREARRLVNGGAHGLDRFRDVFERAKTVWSDVPAVARAGGAAAAAKPKAPARRTTDLRTRKDAADLRDRLYQPAAISLPDEYPPVQEMRKYLPAYDKAGLILDQGQEGACTGFRPELRRQLPALGQVGPARQDGLGEPAHALHAGAPPRRVRGRELRRLELPRRAQGLVQQRRVPGARLALFEREVQRRDLRLRRARGQRHPGRVLPHRDLLDHRHAGRDRAASRGVRLLFTHAGWNAVKLSRTPKTHADLPLIPFDGRRSEEGGHAFALIGFNAQGFILQNSWGNRWGAGGFAVIGYLDWLAHAMDAWVVSLGVPGVVAGRLAVSGTAATEARGSASAADRNKWWDTGLAYQHSVVLGNDGRVSRYLTEDEQPRKLQQQACVLPDDWFRRQPSSQRKRLVLYVHGGLNNEDKAIERACAMGRYFVGNGCYPLFLVWKTGLFESIGGIIAGKLPSLPAGGGVGERITDKTDLLIEKGIGRPLARPIWSEMKENAELAFADRRGGDLLLDALQALASNWKDQFELHLVGHSAGSIAIGHLLSALSARKRAGRDGGLSERLASVNLYAPACTVAFANRHYAGNAAVMERLHLDVLSEKIESDDNVGKVYRKSLLYLVSNALEADLHTPILGLDRVNDEAYSGWDGSSDTGEALSVWRSSAKAAKLDRRTQRVKDDRIQVALDANGKPVLETAGHGGFDNDIGVIGRTLERITGASLALPVDDLRGF